MNQQERSGEAGKWSFNTLTTPDSVRLRYGIYTEGPKDGIDRYIVFLNGHGEFIEKYEYLPKDLQVPKNVAFLTWDHRGQGASEGDPRLHIDDYEILGKDAKFIVDTLVGKKPYSIVAHSMGGLIALYSTMKGFLKPDKLILSAPLFGVQHFIPEAVGRGLANFASRLGFGRMYFQKKLTKMKFENNIFTYSPERFAQRYKSPYQIEGITFGWIKSTFEAIDFVKSSKNVQEFASPTKILYGDDERLVSVKAIKDWVSQTERLGRTKICAKELPHTRHEIFAEADEAYRRVLNLTREYLFGAPIESK